MITKFETPYAKAFKNKTSKPVIANRVRFEFIMDAERDSDILEKLNSIPNKADYIRQLIREDIKKAH